MSCLLWTAGFFDRDLAHTLQRLIDATLVLELDDDTAVGTHDRLDVEGRCEEGLHGRQTSVLPEGVEGFKHEIGLHRLDLFVYEGDDLVEAFSGFL